ncbi:MAG: hypothetical protein PHV34_13885 [Verrucomicrobiae bacterium]|nr:hypothetical protein [Verrucomicrobiae bacterium]
MKHPHFFRKGLTLFVVLGLLAAMTAAMISTSLLLAQYRGQLCAVEKQQIDRLDSSRK